MIGPNMNFRSVNILKVDNGFVVTYLEPGEVQKNVPQRSGYPHFEHPPMPKRRTMIAADYPAAAKIADAHLAKDCPDDGLDEYGYFGAAPMARMGGAAALGRAPSISEAALQAEINASDHLAG